MADVNSKIEVKGLPEGSGISRIFNRIDKVKEVPTDIYDMHEVPEEDRAEFEIKAVDPVTRDELKQLVMSFPTILRQILEANGLTYEEFAGNIPEPQHKEIEPSLSANKKAVIIEYNNSLDQQYNDKMDMVQLTLNEYDQAVSYIKCSAESRDLLANGVVSVNNYKESDGNKLIESNKNIPNIMKVLHDDLCIWVFAKIQVMSSLTTDEVLGL